MRDLMAVSKTETRFEVRKMMPWKYSRVRRKTVGGSVSEIGARFDEIEIRRQR